MHFRILVVIEVELNDGFVQGINVAKYILHVGVFVKIKV
jgi:hypothetical protein